MNPDRDLAWPLLNSGVGTEGSCVKKLSAQQFEPYLAWVLGRPLRVVGIAPLGGTPDEELKGYGYRMPLVVDCELDDGRRRFVLSLMPPAPFGHERREDRARIMLRDHHAFNRLPRHVRSLDVGALTRCGEAISLGAMEEAFLVTDYVEGQAYYTDLARLRDGGELTELDIERADALCDYLAGIHQPRGTDPGLYVRRIRELIGHGECIMGLVDSYPATDRVATAALLEEIEEQCVAWRWRLKQRSHRLRQVHGDFHPWNILFREGTDFTALARARGEWGDPADDVTCLTLNYLFFSLQREQGLTGPLRTLFLRSWDRYLYRSGDEEMLEVAAPFFAFRALVMAHPLWYPDLCAEVRLQLLRFIRRVLAAPSFDPWRVDAYYDA